LIGPADDIDFASARRSLHRPPQPFIAPNRDRELDLETEKFIDDLGRFLGAGVDHIKNTTVARAGQLSPWVEVRKFGINRKSKCFDQVGGDPSGAHDQRALLVGDEKIVGRASEPDGVHRYGIGHDDNAPARRFCSLNLREHVGISGKDGNNDVRLETFQQPREAVSDRCKEAAQIAVRCGFAIEPAVNASPSPRPAIDQGEVGFAYQLVDHSVGFGKQVVHLDLRPGRNAGQGIANSPGGGIVTLAKANGEDQDFFHDGEAGLPGAGADGTLMDI